MESNGLIPETQHDFRAKISTLTAWAQIQQDWANNTDKKLVTGGLMWNLFSNCNAFIACYIRR